MSIVAGAGHSPAFLPSIILGEVFPERFRRPGVILAAVQEIVQGNFFKRIEIPAVLSREEGRAIGALVKEQKISLTCWASEELARKNLNLSALDEGERTRAVTRLRELGDQIMEWGADCLGVLSGPDLREPFRAQAREQLVRSLVELGTGPEARAGLRVMLEPLDRTAHKFGLIGPTREAIDAILAARKLGAAVFMSWDSGHVQLNEEELLPSLRMAAPVTRHLHLSNPVIARESPLFGDHHYPVGVIGVGTAAVFGEILRAAEGMTFPATERVSVAVEVRTQGDLTPEETARHCEAVLRQAMELQKIAA